MFTAPKSFYFMRHGQTDWNDRQLYMGSKDIPINESGIRHAKYTAQRLLSENISMIITSPLSRAVSTATIISEGLGIPVRIMEEFRQCCWGKNEGKSFDNGKMILEWLQGNTPSGAESQIELDQRVYKGLQKTFEMNGNVIIISHGGIYRAIRRILSQPIVHVDHCTPYHHIPQTDMGSSWRITSLKPYNLPSLIDSAA